LLAFGAPDNERTFLTGLLARGVLLATKDGLDVEVEVRPVFSGELSVWVGVKSRAMLAAVPVRSRNEGRNDNR